jgi:hypothetical protein
MRRSGRIAVTGVRGHAERLLTGPVRLDDQALAFHESLANTAEVLVEGIEF